MHVLHKHLQNAITKEQDNRDRLALINLFPELSALKDPYYLSLRCYLNKVPEKFFNIDFYKSL